MNIERLQLMITMLKEVGAGTWTEAQRPTFNPMNEGPPVVKFDLGTWISANRKDCGYVACAVGHACLDARFNELGLVERNGLPTFNPRPDDPVDLFQTRDWRAVYRFFALNAQQAEWLFSKDNYIDEGLTGSAQDVIDRIEAEIAEYQQKLLAETDQLLKDLEP